MQERIAFSACAAVLFKKIFFFESSCPSKALFLPKALFQKAPAATVPLQTLLLVQERRSGSLGPRWCC